MKVKDMIAQLLILPPDAKIYNISDGKPRTSPEFIWATKDGRVIMAGSDESVHFAEDRPHWLGECSYWATPGR